LNRLGKWGKKVNESRNRKYSSIDRAITYIAQEASLTGQRPKKD
jgi:hypothetical protein